MNRSSWLKPLLAVALVTALLLLLPAAAMRLTPEVSWGPGDFVLAGVLLFAAGSAAVVAARLKRPRHRALALAGVALGLLVIWAELAVGLFH